MTTETMIQSHWDYSRGILEECEIDEKSIRIAEYFYKQAFAHGMKHQAEGDTGGGK